MNIKPYLYATLLIAAIALITWHSCDRDVSDTNVVNKAEQARTATIATNTTEHAKYTDRDKLLARIKALRSDSLATAKGKDKQASEKARQSALKYRETRKPEDCSTALVDCQEENATKGYSLAVQERMIAGLESSDSLHREEIERQGETIGKLDNGWKKANEELAKEKGKRFGLGLSAGYGASKFGLSPQVSVSVNYNLWKF